MGHRPRELRWQHPADHPSGHTPFQGAPGRTKGRLVSPHPGGGRVSAHCTSPSGHHKLAILQCSSRWQARSGGRAAFSSSHNVAIWAGSSSESGVGSGAQPFLISLRAFAARSPDHVSEARLVEQKENRANSWDGDFPPVTLAAPQPLSGTALGARRKAGEVPPWTFPLSLLSSHINAILSEMHREICSLIHGAPVLQSFSRH